MGTSLAVRCFLLEDASEPEDADQVKSGWLSEVGVFLRKKKLVSEDRQDLEFMEMSAVLAGV